MCGRLTGAETRCSGPHCGALSVVRDGGDTNNGRSPAQMGNPKAAAAPRNTSPVARATGRFIVRSAASLCAAVVSPLPLRWLRHVGNAFGWLVWLLPSRRRRVARENLAATFGETLSATDNRRIRLRVAQNMSKTMLELLKAPRLGADGVRQAVPAEGIEKISEALAKGKGVICLTAHLGNWEVLAARLAADGFNVAAVARDASDKTLASLINRRRTDMGVRMLTRNSIGEMLGHLRDGGCLMILPDLDAKHGAIRLSFLGRPAWVPRGPAVLAMRSGSPIIPVFCLRQPDDSLRAHVLDEIPVAAHENRGEAVKETMQRINRVLEAAILKWPEQWLWLHNRWKPHNKGRQGDSR